MHLNVDMSSNDSLSRRVNSWGITKHNCDLIRTRTLVQSKPHKHRSYMGADQNDKEWYMEYLAMLIQGE